MDSSGFQSAIRSMDAQNTPSLPNGLTREETDATASVSGLTWHTPKPRGLVEELAAVAAERDRLRKEVETLRMQLVGCGVCAMENTADSVAKRIKRDSPYWSASYGDVCRAVDEEIRLRTLNTELAQALRVGRAVLLDVSPCAEPACKADQTSEIDIAVKAADAALAKVKP